jgi:hypothetical protein
MPLTTYIPNPSLLAEQALITYISSSLSGSSLLDPTTDFNTGVSQSDKEAPMVLVTVNSAQETYFQTRVYRINADISTRQVAFDSYTSSNLTGSAISLSGNVFSLFNDTNLATQGINNLSSSLAVYQVQVRDYKNERMDDAWLSNLNVDLIASLVAG